MAVGLKQCASYQSAVLLRGWHDTISFYRADWKNWLGELFSGAIATLAVPELARRTWNIELSSITTPVLAVVGSALIGVLGFAVFLLLLNLARAGAELYYEERSLAELYTVRGISFDGFVPSAGDQRPCGIMLRSEKGMVIQAAASVKRIWVERTEVAKGSLPKDLSWWNDGMLEAGYQPLDISLLLVLEHIPTEREKGAIQVTVPGRRKAHDWGTSVGLEFRGELGVAVYETRPLMIEIEFRFMINGLYLRAGHQFRLTYDRKRLVSEKVGDWMAPAA